MFEEKSPLLGVVLTGLAVIAGVSTVFSCVVAFLALVKPEAALVIIERWASLPTPTPKVIIATAPAAEPVVTYTPYATYTPYPTQPPPPSYPTPTVSPSRVPVLLSLPFEDNFDTGPRPEWEPIVGTWRMVDGKYTADPSDEWSLTLVGDVGWTDYRIDVDVEYFKDYEPMGIVVRAQNGSHIAFETDAFDSEWILVTEGTSRVIAHGDKGGLRRMFGEDKFVSHLTIEVDGSIYTAYSAGSILLQVQDTSFSSGRVGLAFYYPFDDTTRFDDFQVAALR